MANKIGPMDIFLYKKQMNSEQPSSYSSESENETINDVTPTEGSAPKRIRSSFNRKYDTSYIKFGFVAIDADATTKPQCVICGDVLSNESMKPSKLRRHLNSKHSDVKSKPKEFFERKRDELKCRQKRCLLFRI